MKTVYKYPIQPSAEKIELSIPGGGPVISAALDPNGYPCVWAIADTDEEEAVVNVYCIGTGWPLDWCYEQEEVLQFIGTIKEGPYMWHIFVGGKL